MVAGAGLFVAILLALRRHPASVVAPRLVPAATVIWGVGSLAAILFGIWLAVHVRDYSITDGWILMAVVLWAIAAAIGGRISTRYPRPRAAPRAPGDPGPAGGGEAPLVVSGGLSPLAMIYKARAG